MSSKNNKICEAADRVTPKNDFYPDYEELKNLAGDDEILDLITVMSEPKYFDFINDALNTALKAAGIDLSDCGKNFAKLFCMHNLSYPAVYYGSQNHIQRKLTKDIFEMNEPGRELHEILAQFYGFRDLIDPKETGMLNVSDDQFKEFMTPCK